MESNKLSNWLQVAGNFGLLAGLVLVALQINQNSELLRYQILFQERNSSIESERALLGENPVTTLAKSVNDPLNLSYEDMRIMEALNWTYFEQVRRQYVLRELLGDEWKQSVLSAPFIYGTPFGRAWWSEIRKIYGDNEYGIAIDEILEKNPMTRQTDHFDRVKAALPDYLEKVGAN